MYTSPWAAIASENGALSATSWWSGAYRPLGHGASWNFVFWGLYFGVILLIEKLFLGKLIRKLPNILQWLYAFLLIVFGWVLFEMNSLPAIGNFVAAMFGLNGAGFADRQSLYLILSNIAVILLCAVCATTLPRRVFSWLRSKWESRRKRRTAFRRASAVFRLPVLSCHLNVQSVPIL